MRTVLVLSDDTDESDLLAKALGLFGRWHVEVMVPDVGSSLGANGDKVEARSLDANAPGALPDLVIVDMEMANALAVVERARALWPACALVLRSGREPSELGLAGRLAGAVGFLHEDIDARDLSDEVEHLLALVGLAQAVLGEPGPAAPGSAEDEIRRRLAADPRSAGDARRVIKESLSSWGLERYSDDAALLVTELVTNAVSHVGSEVEVRVVLRAGAVRVEVTDFSPHGTLSPSAATDDAEGGRGLAIVETLASRWGVCTATGGKTVWFELDGPLPGKKN